MITQTPFHRWLLTHKAHPSVVGVDCRALLALRARTPASMRREVRKNKAKRTPSLRAHLLDVIDSLERRQSASSALRLDTNDYAEWRALGYNQGGHQRVTHGDGVGEVHFEHVTEGLLSVRAGV